MRLMGIPDELFGAVKEQVPTEVTRVFRSFDKLINAVKNDKNEKPDCFFIISGKEKSGKSSALSVLAKYSKINDFYTFNSSYYISSIDLRQYVNSKVNYDGTVSYVDRCILADCLFIDELGDEGASDFFMEKLTYILRNRIAHKKPTFIATEMELGKLKDFYKRFPPLIKNIDKFKFVQIGGKA